MTMYTKDIAGNEITEGTKVAFVAPNRHYLTVGIVEAVTPQKVKVRYDGHWITYRKSNQISKIGV